MKLRELKELLTLAVVKNKLRPEKTTVTFVAGCSVGGSTSYIPSKYVNGTYDDPPEAFAKEYDFERDVEVEAGGYRIDKKGSKCVLAVGFFEEGPEGDDYDGGVEWEGDLDGIDAAAEKLGLTGDEDVVVHYDGKDYPLDLTKRQSSGIDNLVSSVEKDKYGTYDVIYLQAPFEPSDAWKKWKANSLADEIDPEDEMEQDRADYEERMADYKRDMYDD